VFGHTNSRIEIECFEPFFFKKKNEAKVQFTHEYVGASHLCTSQPRYRCPISQSVNSRIFTGRCNSFSLMELVCVSTSKLPHIPFSNTREHFAMGLRFVSQECHDMNSSAFHFRTLRSMAQAVKKNLSDSTMFSDTQKPTKQCLN
jgi:hypothetical protein